MLICHDGYVGFVVYGSWFASKRVSMWSGGGDRGLDIVTIVDMKPSKQVYVERGGGRQGFGCYP